MYEKRGLPVTPQQRNFNSQANYPGINRGPASYPPAGRPPFYGQRDSQPLNKNEPPIKAQPQPLNKNASAKKKKNKLLIIILVILIALVALSIVFIVLFLFPGGDNPAAKDRELLAGDFIDKAVVRDEQKAYVILEHNINSNEIANITLVFNTNNSKYNYFSKFVGSTYSVSASDLGLDSFEGIVSVDAVIAFVTSPPNPPVDPNLPPNDSNAGKCSTTCEDYYHTGKCGTFSVPGCNKSLTCTSCNKGFYCYMGEGVRNICISSLISCEDSDGRDYYRKGIVKINNSGAFLSKEDSCSGELKEYYCYFNGSRFEAKIYSKECEYGCADGECTVPSCESDFNCSSLGGICGIAKCNLTSNKCYVSYNSSTALCRNNVSECDEKEFCSGDNADCPDDSNKTDASMCSIGICKSGKCRLDKGPVSYWNFNGNAEDSVGTSDGTVYGAVLSEGALGQAYSFDGVDDSIEIQNSESINLTNNFTISVWVSLQPTSTNYPGIFWKNDTIVLRYSPPEGVGNEFQGFVRISNNLEPRVSFGPYTEYNRWYNIVLTYNSGKSENNLQLYVDGELKSQASRTGAIDASAGKFYIGRYISIPAKYFKGKIDEVKVWNYALNEEAIKSEYKLVNDSLPVTVVTVPVYRFFNGANVSHFYTASESEKANIIANYSQIYLYEGVVFYAHPNQATGTVPVYRFYNNQNGAHFYTASESEKAYLLSNFSQIITLEGIAFYSYPNQATGTVPVYRFYNNQNGAHFYTASESERAYIIANYSYTYISEGIVFYVYPKGEGISSYSEALPSLPSETAPFFARLLEHIRRIFSLF